MTTPCPEPFIAFAEELAEAAGAVTRRYFRRPLEVADKADASPVTVRPPAASNSRGNDTTSGTRSTSSNGA